MMVGFFLSIDQFWFIHYLQKSPHDSSYNINVVSEVLFLGQRFIDQSHLLNLWPLKVFMMAINSEQFNNGVPLKLKSLLKISKKGKCCTK